MPARAPAKKPNPERLRRRAFFYLQRFGTSRAHLHEILSRRASREASHFELDMSQVESWIVELLDDLERLGLLNDEAYAGQLFRRLTRQGKSSRQVRAALQAKGLAKAIIDNLFAESSPQLELQAALRLAERKRLGPWRTGEVDAIGKRKELAAFARAGFGYAIAQMIVERDRDELDFEIEPPGGHFGTE